MNFGQHYTKSVRVNEKKKTDDKPYKLTIIPTLIDWVQRALVGACDMDEARRFSLPEEQFNALAQLNSVKMFDSGTPLRLKVSPLNSMVIEEQIASKDSTIFNAKLRDNMKLEWRISRLSNQATDYVRTILKVLPTVLANYHKTCLQALKDQEIGRVGDLENDAKRYIELAYALNYNLNWKKVNDIDYLAYRSGMNLESIIAILDYANTIRTDLSAKFADKHGVPHACMRSGLFRDNQSSTFMLGSERLNIKNDRDVSIRLMCRVFEERISVRSIVSKNNYLEDDYEASDSDDDSTAVKTNAVHLSMNNSDNNLEDGTHGTCSTANAPNTNLEFTATSTINSDGEESDPDA